MRSGKLDRIITVQRATSTPNDVGTPVETWSTVASLRAEVLRQSTAEYLGDAGARDETVVVFRTRFLDGVTNADRIVFEGQTFNLKEVVPIGRQRGLELRAEALA